MSDVVWTLADEGAIPAGSGISVRKELKHHYKGVWSSMYGTYTVKVKKSNCTNVDPMKKYQDIINKALANPSPELKKSMDALNAEMDRLHPGRRKEK